MMTISFKIMSVPTKMTTQKKTDRREGLERSLQQFHVPRTLMYENKNKTTIFKLLRARTGTENDNQICKLCFFTSDRNLTKASSTLKDACQKMGTSASFQPLSTELLRVYSAHKETERKLLNPS